MELEWDAKKSRQNLEKHSVDFHEAGSVFGDPLALTFDDPDHSGIEDRYLTFGFSESNRLLAVVHTVRNGRTRIISARKATPRERTIYENG